MYKLDSFTQVNLQGINAAREEQKVNRKVKQLFVQQPLTNDLFSTVAGQNISLDTVAQGYYDQKQSMCRSIQYL